MRFGRIILCVFSLLLSVALFAAETSPLVGDANEPPRLRRGLFDVWSVVVVISGVVALVVLFRLFRAARGKKRAR